MLTEITVRIAGLAPEIAVLTIAHSNGEFVSSLNPDVKYQPRPSVGLNNSYGTRGPEFSIAKPADTYRIILLGDSIGYGYCPFRPLQQDELISAQLEKKLNASGISPKHFEVINMSVSGFDTRQEVAWFKEKGLILNPDLVVVLYCLNDDQDASLELGYFETLSDWKSIQFWSSVGAKTVVTHSALARYMIQTMPAVQQIFVTPTNDEHRPDDTITGRTVHDAFVKLSKITTPQDIPVLVVVFPLMIDFQNYTEKWEHERTKRFANEFGFSYLDLLDEFQEKFGHDYPAVACMPNTDPFHPNAQGAALAGHQIGQYLIRKFAQQKIEAHGAREVSHITGQ